MEGLRVKTSRTADLVRACDCRARDRSKNCGVCQKNSWGLGNELNDQKQQPNRPFARFGNPPRAPGSRSLARVRWILRVRSIPCPWHCPRAQPGPCASAT